jgi:hypothetical protein
MFGIAEQMPICLDELLVHPLIRFERREWRADVNADHLKTAFSRSGSTSLEMANQLRSGISPTCRSSGAW